MNWEYLIESFMEIVKDEETRTEIYQKLLEASDDIDIRDIEVEFGGIDNAFDNAVSLYEDIYETDEIDEEEDEGDNDYEIDDDGGEWEIEESED
jgi:hypothetical protein